MAREHYGYPVRRIRVNGVDYGHSVGPRDGRSRTRGPIVYNRHGKVTDGNHRLQEARRRGDRTIEAIYVPDSDVGHGCGLVIIAYAGVSAVLGSSTWLAFSGWLA